MVLTNESQVNGELAGLLYQFLMQSRDALAGSEAQTTEHETQAVMCVVQLAGVQYTLTRQPYAQENGGRVCLSPREKEVVQLVMKGHSTRAIAAVLEISPWTVSTHLRRIFAKLGVNSRPEMVARVLHDGVIEGSG